MPILYGFIHQSVFRMMVNILIIYNNLFYSANSHTGSVKPTMWISNVFPNWMSTETARISERSRLPVISLPLAKFVCTKILEYF